jgi:hypothetical protein
MAAPAVLKTLEFVWAAIEPLQLSVAVMGGLALSAWKYPRTTRDVDLLVGVEPNRVAVLLDALRAAGFRAKRTPALRPLGRMQILQLEFDPPDAFVSISVDVLLVDCAYGREALKRRLPLRLPGIERELQVLSCEDVLLHKIMAGRVIDRSDAAALIRANRQSLDLAYLSHWARNLDLDDALAEIWKEACPDEQPAI